MRGGGRQCALRMDKLGGVRDRLGIDSGHIRDIVGGRGCEKVGDNVSCAWCVLLPWECKCMSVLRSGLSNYTRHKVSPTRVTNFIHTSINIYLL